MRVMVTGACGMLGRLVCAGLAGPERIGGAPETIGAGKHEVIATDVVEAPNSSGQECLQLDIVDTNAVFASVEKHRPDVVIHCAAMTDVDGCERDPDRAFKVNAIGTWNLACACASIDAAIAYVSTDYVFDGEKGDPYTEFDRTNPTSAYGASKLAGERAVIELCPRHYVVRTSWLFAPHGKNFALTMLRVSENNKEVRAVADQVGCPTYAKDLAGFLVSLVGSPLYGVYHYTNSGSCSWHEFAKAIIESVGRQDVNVVPINSEEWPTPTKRPRYSVLRHYVLELLGRDNARPWQEAVAEFADEWTTAKQ